MKRIALAGAMFIVVLAGSTLVLSRVGEMGSNAGSLRAVSPGSASGKSLYERHCAACHGSDGKGNGPAAAALPAPSTDFTSAQFWQGNVDKKIEDAVQNGHGSMPPITMSPDDTKAVTVYMSDTFKK